ncbi:prisilkin-39-like [Periplaneta americana]|uniref:prisilkin-39-like n=1 Tax=Periplaneta americana TaxID=6978 RepID=UPI0037E77FFA
MIKWNILMLCTIGLAQAQLGPIPNGPQFVDGDDLEGIIGDEIPGIAGVDYPVLAQVPPTGFNCEDEPFPGYYADPLAGCQVFYICQKGGRGTGFLCPNGTVFNQEFLVCDWWYNFDCDNAINFYGVNAEVARAMGDVDVNTAAALAQRVGIGNPAAIALAKQRAQALGLVNPAFPSSVTGGVGRLPGGPFRSPAFSSALGRPIPSSLRRPLPTSPSTGFRGYGTRPGYNSPFAYRPTARPGLPVQRGPAAGYYSPYSPYSPYRGYSPANRLAAARGPASAALPFRGPAGPASGFRPIPGRFGYPTVYNPLTGRYRYNRPGSIPSGRGPASSFGKTQGGYTYNRPNAGPATPSRGPSPTSSPGGGYTYNRPSGGPANPARGPSSGGSTGGYTYNPPNRPFTTQTAASPTSPTFTGGTSSPQNAGPTSPTFSGASPTGGPGGYNYNRPSPPFITPSTTSGPSSSTSTGRPGGYNTQNTALSTPATGGGPSSVSTTGSNTATGGYTSSVGSGPSSGSTNTGSEGYRYDAPSSGATDSSARGGPSVGNYNTGSGGYASNYNSPSGGDYNDFTSPDNSVAGPSSGGYNYRPPAGQYSGSGGGPSSGYNSPVGYSRPGTSSNAYSSPDNNIGGPSSSDGGSGPRAGSGAYTPSVPDRGYLPPSK